MKRNKHFLCSFDFIFIHEKMAHHGEKPEQSLEDMEAELSQPRGTLRSYIAFLIGSLAWPMGLGQMSPNPPPRG